MECQESKDIRIGELEGDLQKEHDIFMQKTELIAEYTKETDLKGRIDMN